MPRHCALRIAWWWPLAFALVVLAFGTAIALATGTAHADGGSTSSDGSSQSEKSQTEKSPSETSQTEKSPSDDRSAPGDHQSATDPVTSPPKKAEETTSARDESAKDRSTVSEKAATKGKRSHDDGAPAVAEPTSSDPPATTIRSRPDRHLRLVAESGVEAVQKTAQVAQPAAAASATRTADVANATSTVVALPTVQPTKPGGTNLQREFERFVRQLVGLASDVGIVGASLVNNLAVQAATAIGPQPFWGVPYAVANGIADTAANVSKTLSGTPLNAKSTGRFTVNYGVLDVVSFFNPTKVPAGANDPTITTTVEHPLPVLLVNGTVETQSLNWSVGAPVLANAGYKVYTFNYGNVTPFPNFPIQSTADVRTSAAEMSTEIDRILLETGAPKVILVGHSQGGGILPAYYINQMDGADKVSQLIGLAPSNHGTDFDGLLGFRQLPILGPLLFGLADVLGPALGQQLASSPFQDVVYGNGDTRPGVLYTTIASKNDEVVTPYTQQALDGPAVTNIVLQDRFPGLPTGHIGVASISQTWDAVLAALAGNPQANPLLNLVPTAA